MVLRPWRLTPSSVHVASQSPTQKSSWAAPGLVHCAAGAGRRKRTSGRIDAGLMNACMAGSRRAAPDVAAGPYARATGRELCRQMSRAEDLREVIEEGRVVAQAL